MLGECCTMFSRVKLAKLLATQHHGASAIGQVSCSRRDVGLLAASEGLFRRDELQKLARYLREGRLDRMKAKVQEHVEIVEQRLRQSSEVDKERHVR